MIQKIVKIKFNKVISTDVSMLICVVIRFYSEGGDSKYDSDYADEWFEMYKDTTKTQMGNKK